MVVFENWDISKKRKDFKLKKTRQRGPEGTHHVRAQVNAEDGDGSQRKRNAGEDEEEKRGDLWDVAG